MEKNSIIYIPGHRGLAGSAILRCLQKKGYTHLIYLTSQELDLRNQSLVQQFFEKEKPEFVFLAAGKVGGIRANIENPGSFLYDNIMIQSNIIHQSYLSGVKKILVLGSSCIYPTNCPQPMKEDYLLDGKLEPTNEGYALSKIVALKQAIFYRHQYGLNAISVMPPNLYGINDSFDPKYSHVLSATVKKFVDAVDNNLKTITMWGTGNARREFMHADDLAEASLFMMQHYDEENFINIGWGYDISIRELAQLIAELTEYKGQILWDASKPDGMMKKCLDITRMKEIGFMPKITIKDGIQQMINNYKAIKK